MEFHFQSSRITFKWERALPECVLDIDSRNNQVSAISKCPAISDHHLRCPSKRYIGKIFVLHKKAYCIDGCLGCFDVTKIQWTACPAAWKGQFKEKEGFPTIGLDVVSDYNLWIWHCPFGYLNH